ncbi:hypothetical protein [Vreelandella nanhaiensis]|uniref:Sulfotransferase family protein n=1 Tax=Vreelandella nanhaiensis TaxID=1258546 RepID=A0A3S0W711_9GAMM|nr:hypothetical protein [Halomonas nanhaiensis]RUR29985.1 hypothetical protein ELY38_14155 [Halomonas nanhaiensis]
MIKKKFSQFLVSRTLADCYDVVLHIGAPKTGSSAIQRFCSLNKKSLESLGFYYPDHPLDKNGVSGGHTQVAGALINGNVKVANSRLLEWLEVAKSKNLTLILSAEAFYGLHKQMAQSCRGLKVKVVGFLRHPLDYMLGNHNQGIKRHMMTKRLNQAIPEMLSQPTPHLVGKPFCNWADEFGDENCIFLPYRAPGHGAPIELSFLKALGVSEKAAKRMVGEVSVTNRSYVKSALEVKRLLNTVLPELPESYAHQVDWCLQGYSDKALNETPYQISDIPAVLLKELSSHLLQQMEEVKARFPELKEATTFSAEDKHQSSDDINLINPLQALRNEIPDIYFEVKNQALQLRGKGKKDYAFLKLLELLNIDFVEPAPTETLLPESALKILASSKAQAADYLRETALILERAGCIKEALEVIELAQQKRPNGEGIKQIKLRLKKIAEKNIL